MEKRRKWRSDQILVLVCSCLMGGTFAVDLMVPLGVYSVVFYVASLLMLLKLEDAAFWPITGSLIASLLLVIQSLLHQSFGLQDSINYLALPVVWMTGGMVYFCLLYKNTNRDLARHRAMERIGDVIYGEWNLVNGKFSWLNSESRIANFDPANFLSTQRDFLKAIHPDDRSLLVDQLNTSLTNLSPVDVEVRVRLPDFNEMHLRLKGMPGSVADGTVTTCNVIVENVDHLRRLEFEPDQGESIFRATFEGSNDALLLVDFEGAISMLNRQVTSLLGFSAAELVGKPIEMLVPDRVREHHPELRHTYSQAPAARNLSDRRDLTVRSSKGFEIPVEISLSPITMTEGSFTLVSIRDIRNREVMQGQLRQSQKMESLGRLAGGIAHDLNNVFTAIIAFATLSQKETSHEVIDENQEEIVRASERASAMISQLLSFTVQKMQNRQVINMNEVVSEMLKMLRPLIRANIELRFDLKDIDNIYVDQHHLEEIVMNLVLNSIDAIQGGGVVSISTANAVPDNSADLDEGEYIALTVADTGQGIAFYEQAKIFEPFYTTKPKNEGTGLGLAVVYGIVKSYKGDVTVDSEPGKGASFTVYIPKTNASGKPAEKPIDVPIRRKHLGRILLVDDEDQIRRITKRVLEKSGYSVDTSEDGESALALLLAGSYDCQLLITDIMLPGISGQTLADQVSRQCPGLPVLMISGYSSEHILKKANVNFLAKPFTPQRLLAQVEALIGPVVELHEE